MKYSSETINKLNKDLEKFPFLTKITNDMNMTFSSVSRMVMLDRYTYKDLNLATLTVGDLIITVVRNDPKFPTRGIGNVVEIENDKVKIKLEEEFISQSEDCDENGIITRLKTQIDKPLELFYEQISSRVANNLAGTDGEQFVNDAYHELSSLNLVPAGRVLFGAGSNTNVTYFNCFVMPYIADSRGGISDHRKQVMEIMSRGGGVGTNGSTLRPRNALAKGVNGKSSGAVSWLNDLSQLTHLVEQGGSRRGAQMIMLADWHPDVIEFIISKMQNVRVLKFILETTNEPLIKEAVKNKIKFNPLSVQERSMYEKIMEISEMDDKAFDRTIIDKAYNLLKDGGEYEVLDPEFLTGANISIAITKEFMEAVKNDTKYTFRFPDVASYNDEQKEAYNNEWQHCGDVREWGSRGFKVKNYSTINAKDLWDLINICATYSAEPGIFFIDNANEYANAKGYKNKVVCTNPCGEQPLAPYSVCNLAAINLANFANKDKNDVDWDKLHNTIKTAVRIQDNVIDKTTYFLKENEDQALGERRVGLGIMGLHDLLININLRYGSKESLKFIDKLFKFMATKAYLTSIDLAKEKGSFPFLEELGSKEEFVASKYIQKLPKEVRDGILKHGIRNSHLLTIAPTGSTGTMVGVSTGLEPYFAFKYFRSGRLGKFIEVNAPIVESYLKEHKEYSSDNLPDIFVSAMELTPKEHVDVQCTIQNWIDSSISKTVNAPRGYTVEQVEDVYMSLYDGNAKGGTVYVDGSRDAQVLTLSNDDTLKQLDMLEIDKSIELEEKHLNNNKKESNKSPKFFDRQDRNIGVEAGDICPICNEGVVEELGGCNTCTSCNAQLKCGL